VKNGSSGERNADAGAACRSHGEISGGGLVTSAFLTLEVLPVLYTIWRYRQLHRSQRTGVPLETIVGAVPAWARR
jgi:hypothetical protein